MGYRGVGAASYNECLEDVAVAAASAISAYPEADNSR